MTPDTDPIAALQRRIDKQAALIGLLTSETPGKPPPCEDHDMLRVIHKFLLAMLVPPSWLAPAGSAHAPTRESEAVEFTDDDTGRHFEIVVRRIDQRSAS